VHQKTEVAKQVKQKSTECTD